jgi:hypothetical protein
MSKIEGEKHRHRYKLDTATASKVKMSRFKSFIVSPTGFEPVLPT